MKPSNMLLTEANGVKLCDFGLAREFDSRRTHPKVLLGSVEFLPPEQLSDAATAGPAADVYSLGVSLFWVLTGQLPFEKVRSTAEMIETIRTRRPRRLRDVNPNLPADLDALFAKVLARLPDERPGVADLEGSFARLAAPSPHPVVLDEFIVSDDDSDAGKLRATVRRIEELLVATAKDAELARSATLFALSAFSVARPGESPEHQIRMAKYSRALAETLSQQPAWLMFSTPAQQEELGRAAAAHDLGLVAVPDADLADGREDHTHPVIGSDLLDTLARKHGPAMPYLRVLQAVVRHHHERWDGGGFPDQLTADYIPPAARIVAVADAYDDLRRKGGLRHREALSQLRRQAAAAFDPAVIEALGRCEADFRSIFDQYPEAEAEVVVEEDTRPE
jgi:putative two-component system response regulator